MAHDDVVVPVYLAVLALALVVVVTLRAQRQLHVTPAAISVAHSFVLRPVHTTRVHGPCSRAVNTAVNTGVILDTRPATRKLECGPMPNVMAALSNIDGALCSTPQSLADAQYWSAVQQRCQDAKPIEIC